jgi:hypothetical protein
VYSNGYEGMFFGQHYLCSTSLWCEMLGEDMRLAALPLP